MGIYAVLNPATRRWEYKEFPELISAGFPTLLVPKAFVGRSMLSSPGQLLQKYALSYRQKEHLDKRNRLCHKKQTVMGRKLGPLPRKRKSVPLKSTGVLEKEFLLEMGYRHPKMIDELHTDHKFINRKTPRVISDLELDALFYGKEAAAI